MPILTLPGSFALHASAKLAELLHRRFKKGERSPFNKNAPTCNGIEATAVLNQLHYWIEKGYGVTYEDRRWIFNTQEEWLRQFPGLSKYRLRQIFNWLKERGFIETCCLSDNGRDRTKYYTINYDELAKIGVQWQGEKFLAPESKSFTLQASKIEHCNDQTLDNDLYTKNTLTKNTPIQSTIKSERIVEPNGEDFFQEENSRAIATQEEDQAMPTAGNANANQEDEVESADESSLSLKDLDQLDPEQAAELVDPETPPVPRHPPLPKPIIKEKLSPKVLEYRLEAIAAIMPVNETIAKAVETVSDLELEKALTLYQVEDEELRVQKPQAWLVACLRGEWWEEKVDEIVLFIENKISDVLDVLDHPFPKYDFWQKYWWLVENGFTRSLGDRGDLAYGWQTVHHLCIAPRSGGYFIMHNGQWLQVEKAFEMLCQ